MKSTTTENSLLKYKHSQKNPYRILHDQHKTISKIKLVHKKLGIIAFSEPGSKHSRYKATNNNLVIWLKDVDYAGPVKDLAIACTYLSTQL